MSHVLLPSTCGFSGRLLLVAFNLSLVQDEEQAQFLQPLLTEAGASALNHPLVVSAGLVSHYPCPHLTRKTRLDMA